MSYKTFNGLMKHMRANSGLTIEGSIMKKQLMNMGYFHGYKGYRFFANSSILLGFRSFNVFETFILNDSFLINLEGISDTFSDLTLRHSIKETRINSVNHNIEFIITRLI